MRTIKSLLMLTIVFVITFSSGVQSGSSVSVVVGQGEFGEYTITYPDTVALGKDIAIDLTLNVHTLPNTTMSDQYYFQIHQIIGVNSIAGILDEYPSMSVPGEYHFSYITNVRYHDNIPLGQWGFMFTVYAVLESPGGVRFHQEMVANAPNYILGDHDINRDSSLNVADITYLIKYIFASGPKPKRSIPNADMNCDQSVNIADITKLIGYLFGGTASLPCFAGGG